jgi:P27 family predicted phage terminase small subunit
MRGRKPTPTALKILRGNPGQRPLNRREPTPVGDLTAPPDWLTDSQKEAWAYALAHAPLGLLKRIDAGVLTVWVVAEDLHRDASAKMTQPGVPMLVMTARKKLRPSPFIRIIEQQSVIMLKAASELGFTPASRSRGL